MQCVTLCDTLPARSCSWCVTGYNLTGRKGLHVASFCSCPSRRQADWHVYIETHPSPVCSGKMAWVYHGIFLRAMVFRWVGNIWGLARRAEEPRIARVRSIWRWDVAACSKAAVSRQHPKR
jgi:hypothetical protein